MSIYQHTPAAPLAALVERFWYYVDYLPDHDRQHVLPDGTFELMFNLEERPRKLFEHAAPHRFDSFKRGWVSGTHAHYLVIDALPRSTMIGVHFKPGGAARFLGMPAVELSGRVVELDAFWGDDIWEWRERLLEANGPRAKFQVLEQLLRLRLAGVGGDGIGRKGVHWALGQLVAEPHQCSIGQVAGKLGVSHKHFIEQFKREVGLPPKLFCRIRRFHQVLGQIQSRKTVDWADVAFSCGYFDQAHFINDFKAFSGLNPSVYLRERLEGDPGFVRAVA